MNPRKQALPRLVHGVGGEHQVESHAQHERDGKKQARGVAGDAPSWRSRGSSCSSCLGQILVRVRLRTCRGTPASRSDTVGPDASWCSPDPRRRPYRRPDRRRCQLHCPSHARGHHVPSMPVHHVCTAAEPHHEVQDAANIKNENRPCMSVSPSRQLSHSSHSVSVRRLRLEHQKPQRLARPRTPELTLMAAAAIIGLRSTPKNP